ncbi:uncharacterized protein LOC101863493 isoform X1 [Aplysia californica]|uniref:Uncharacterized protein LOC101863493 isoform X1 n=1 Tax=Aplysia californica TaxID=6500 RepID=A0ABM1VPD7_APLCA|nr:uncharacterized protein LOC101863493 isoform X1 [Aplysia californica]XP_035824280.1 uncharacterized protein LOC101863493 isoform X1 [Aplysia californica]XP_035824281.1 uncharacterized protein LOC101863493 isoform X1 [Aplysia californica]
MVDPVSRRPYPPSYGTDTTGSVSGPSCTFTIQASELGAGTHRLSVNMYPQFDGSGVAYGNISTVSPDVTFCYPVPEIVNCPSGAKVSGDHIMSGSTATCKCRQKTEGFPAGTVVLSQGGSTLGSGTVASGTVINPGNNNNDQTLTCRSESSLGQAGPSVSKIVKFAYGPRSATLTFSPTSPSSLCQGPSLSVVSTCTVDPRTVNPQPLYKISVNGAPVGTPVQQTLQLQGGAHNISCLIENALFPADLFTDVTETFIVRVPPPGPPEITVSQPSVPRTGETLVKENVTTRVQCVVRGGYPATSDVRLSCPSSQAGSSGVSSVVVTRSQGTQCSCTATHESGCYDKRSDITIKAAYGPESVMLERKKVRPEETGTYNLCPSATPDITMECSVGVVYPAASLTLTMTPTRTQTADACTGNNNKCSYNFVPTRGGNHEFRCDAVNNAFGDMRGDSPTVQVYVREPPKVSPKLTLNGKDFTGATADNSVVFVDGQENSIVCQVDGGFPKISPSDIYVQCDGENVTDGRVVFTPERNATYCTCRAQHPSGCYDLSTEVLVIVILQNKTQSDQSDDQMTIPVAVGAACAAFVLCCIITGAVYCYLKRKGCFQRLAKHKEEQSGMTRDNNGHQEENPYVDVDSVHISLQDIHTPVLIGRTMAEIITPDVTQTDGDGRRYNNVPVKSPVPTVGEKGHQEENPYVDVDSDHISSQDIHTPVITPDATQTDGDGRRYNNVLATSPVSRTRQKGHQEESPYVDVDSDHISSQDIHTPVLIGRTMAEIITPDATQTDGDGRRYNNVLVTSPVSTAGQKSRQEESPYVDVDSDHISSQDIHTPVLIGRTTVEIITPDATRTDGDGRRYNNVLVTSPVATSKKKERPKGNQYVDADMDLINAKNANTKILIGKTTAKTSTPDTRQAGYDDGRRYNNVSVTQPESGMGQKDQYMGFQPKAEYFNVDIDEDVDGHYSSPRNNAPVKGNYVNVQRHDKK